jgi:four helix bundle protein
VAGEQGNSTKPRHYKELLIWQRGMRLAKTVYHLTAEFPADERYGLTSQMKRAVVSIPSNIAEGQARRSAREFALFLGHASGSLAELETQLLLSADLGYAKPLEVAALEGEIGEIQKMIGAIQRRLSERSGAVANEQ